MCSKQLPTYTTEQTDASHQLPKLFETEISLSLVVIAVLSIVAEHKGEEEGEFNRDYLGKGRQVSGNDDTGKGTSFGDAECVSRIRIRASWILLRLKRKLGQCTEGWRLEFDLRWARL